MALSKAEQELLAQLESSLAAEDPKLAQKMAQAPVVRRIHPKRATFGALGVLGGIALLLVGMSTTIWLSVVGFVVMLASAVFLMTAWQPSTPTDGRAATASEPVGVGDLMSRLEQRWRDRLEGGQ